MSNKLYVGNLSFSATNESLSQAFSKCGTVQSAKVIMDRDTGRSKGFAFVEMSTSEEGLNAIAKLNASELDGRAMNVSEAKPMVARDNNSRGGSSGNRY